MQNNRSRANYLISILLAVEYNYLIIVDILLSIEKLIFIAVQLVVEELFKSGCTINNKRIDLSSSSSNK